MSCTNRRRSGGPPARGGSSSSATTPLLHNKKQLFLCRCELLLHATQRCHIIQALLYQHGVCDGAPVPSVAFHASLECIQLIQQPRDSLLQIHLDGVARVKVWMPAGAKSRIQKIIVAAFAFAVLRRSAPACCSPAPAATLS